MLMYRHGDILTDNTDKNKKVIVCQQVNCLGVAGAGLAKQVREQLDGSYIAYRDTCNSVADKHSLLGKTQFLDYTDSHGYILANCFGQFDFGRNGCYTDYGALRSCFRTIYEYYKDCTIRIPHYMGCGLAGGNWRRVLDVIEDELFNKGVDVEIWGLSFNR